MNLREWLIKQLGGIPAPKVQAGQYLRRPSVCKKPVRVKTIKEAIEQAGGEVHVAVMKMTMFNLCDNCQASAQDCRKAVKEMDGNNNTTDCNQCK